MSSPMTRDTILYLQRTCASCGLYDGPLDGRWTGAVDQAEAAFATAAGKAETELGTFDSRSERNIATLMIPAQRAARQFMRIAGAFPYAVRILSGTRTYAEQDALYAIGRTIQLNKKPVTKAKGGQSNHNFGVAWDVGIFSADGRYMTGATRADQLAYNQLAERIKAALPRIEWGGDWPGFPDAPHYQLVGARSVADTRALFEAGKPLS